MVNQYATPVLIGPDGSECPLTRTPLDVGSRASGYDESWLQDIMFRHPACLPISEINQSFLGLVPLAREVSTPAGYIDVLYATPEGRLVLVEAKLWRNPEARREVIGQILDYAKEIARWSYEDLQREVSRAAGEPGNYVFEAVKRAHPDVDETSFVDGVSRSLRTGDFLLLIVGDGIREGVGAITEFLDQNATLQFTFGLVEMGVYEVPERGRLLQPRVIAQSVIVKRSVIELADEGLRARDQADEMLEDEELTNLQRFYQDFWTEFLAELRLDDVSQPLPNPTKIGNVFIIPRAGDQSWITIYFSKAKNEVGVYLTFYRGDFGDRAYASLREERSQIDRELNLPVEWQSDNGKYRILVKKRFSNIYDTAYREEIKSFLAAGSNAFVNTFLHRIERIFDQG